MTALIAWGGPALLASAALMLLVLAVRAPVRRLVEPQLGYALWALPVARLILPTLPTDLLTAIPLAGRVTNMPILFVGPSGVSGSWREIGPPFISDVVPVIWLIGVIGVFALYTTRHLAFCRKLRANGTDHGRIGTIRIIATDVEGPLAFGVFQRFIAVPRTFDTEYDAYERDLALAHECAHHARGDLIANWASIVVLAIHWWNPVAWIAIRGFRDDQEFAIDAHVLAAKGADVRASYAHVLAKAAGIGALPACNLNARSNLRGRLIMLGQKQQTSGRLAVGGVALVFLSGTALTATALTPATSGATTGKQAVTIGVKPDGSGGYALLIGSAIIAPGRPLPGGMTLPADFRGSRDCDLKASAKPFAMVIKGMGKTQTYTIMCASAAPAPVRATLAEGLTSLNTMRISVATQPASKLFPETERTHALGAIDRSIHEVEATLSTIA